jgi:hypothetical protein
MLGMARPDNEMAWRWKGLAVDVWQARLIGQDWPLKTGWRYMTRLAMGQAEPTDDP